MIQPNAKIEKNNGLRFFEQDVLYDDFMYNDYAELTLTVDYCMPGFGVVLINSTSSLLTNECEAFLFRIGYREASIEYKNGNVYQTIITIPITLVPSINNIVKFRFEKSGKNITLEVDGQPIINSRTYKLPKSISKYCLGIYSNAGNTIKEIYSSSKIPNYWNINMYNTVGGRIRFSDNGFTLSECSENAEIEQYALNLTAGQYYLKYDSSDNSDIECYVFDSEDPSIIDSEKNMLDNNNSFYLEHDAVVNLKFVGTSGTISNIILNADPDTKYVATQDDNINVSESKITVNRESVHLINWTGEISSIFSSEESFILENGTYKCTIDDSGIDFNKEYKYEYNMETDTLFVFDLDERLLHTCTSSDSAEYVTIFNNVDATISDFYITKANGDIINYITSDTEKRSISINRNAPIIITDETGEPLDISSSYRIYTTFNDDGEIDYTKDKIVFTNIEREIYDPQLVLRTTSYINNSINSVKIFGIKEAEIDYDYFYRVEKNDNDIGLCCNYNYELIDGDKYTISNNCNEIYFQDIDVDEYTYIVVDYLKDDSYCINPNFTNNTYEIEISTNKLVHYYFDVDNSLVSEYLIIPFDSFVSDNDSYYLCIRKESEEEQDDGGETINL